MALNRIAFAALAVGCIGAAGAGGYLALRQNATTTTPAPAATEAMPAPSPVVSERPAQETAASVADAKPVAPALPATVEPAAPARRVEPPSRSSTTVPARVRERATASRPSAEPTPTPDRVSGTTPAVPAAPPPSAPPLAESASAPAPESVAASTDDQPIEPAREPEGPVKTYDEIVVPADSVVGLQIETPVTSELARIEDRVDARVTRDVRVANKVAIPAGTRAIGSVTQVERGGKLKGVARLGIRFHTLVLADNTRMPVSTEAIVRAGEAPGNASAAKIGGGAAVGTILGAIIGGRKGALIGGAAGAGAGSASVAAGERNAVTLPAGTPISVRLLSPVTVTVEQE